MASLRKKQIFNIYETAFIIFSIIIVLFSSCSKEFEVKRQDNAIKIASFSKYSCQNPVFSPDGQYLVYTRFLRGYNIGPSELVKIKIDGSAEKIIVSASDADNVNVPQGSWVKNKICFSSDRGGGADEIWIVNDDGSYLEQISFHEEKDGIYYIEPVFNPKNTDLIAFEYVKGENDANAIHRIALLNVNTGSIKLLTDTTYDDRLPGWSHDGKKILFQRNEYGQDEGWKIYVADIDTEKSNPLSNIHSISYGNSDDTDCSWSFDDKYILSSSNHGGLEEPNIFLFSVDKSCVPVRATFSSSNEDGAAAQSPNGEKIAFESHYGKEEDYPSSIWIIEHR